MGRPAKTLTFVSLQKFHFVFAHSLVHATITSVLLNILLIFSKSSLAATSFNSSIEVLFPCAWYYQQLSSSTFLSRRLNATINFAAQIIFSNTVSFYLLKMCASNTSAENLKTLCLPFSISESKTKCLHVSHSSVKFSTSIFLQKLCDFYNFGLWYTLRVVHFLSDISQEMKTSRYLITELTLVKCFG